MTADLPLSHREQILHATEAGPSMPLLSGPNCVTWDDDLHRGGP
ncbi:hypothetical protein [Micromonospora sp. KC721]|nr:hypothetical protein [Micromonospora sp. KC721]